MIIKEELQLHKRSTDKKEEKSKNYLHIYGKINLDIFWQ